MKYKPKSVFTRDYKNYVLLQENFYDIDDVNIAANIFRTYLKDIFDQHASIKSKTHKGKLAVWLRADLKKQINKKINFYVKLGNQKQLRIGQHTSVQEINVMGKFVKPNANITAILWKKTKRTLESFGTQLKQFFLRTKNLLYLVWRSQNVKNLRKPSLNIFLKL